MCLLRNEGEPLLLVYMSEGRKEGCAPPFERDLATAGRSGPPFFGEPLGREMPKLVLARAFHLPDSRTRTGDGCLFLLEGQ